MSNPLSIKSSSGPAVPLVVEPLSGQHDRSVFCCGEEALDRYFREQAGQDLRRRIAAPFVLLRRDTGAVVGFYTLANTAIDASRLPSDLTRKLPQYPLIPATLLGRLAIDQRNHGQKLGEFLLLDALCRSLQTSQQVASFAVVVEAKNASAAAFYTKYGFMAFADAPKKLFLPMKTIEALFT